MRKYTWIDLPDNPERVGDEDYKPPYRPEMDEDEAYERERDRQWNTTYSEKNLRGHKNDNT